MRGCLLRLLRIVPLLLLLVVGSVLWWWHWATGAFDPQARAIHRVVVAEGASPATVGRLLANDGIIRSRRAFAYLGRGVTIRPGVYDLSAAETPSRILRHLERGDFATIRVTIPEGFTVRQIAHRLFRMAVIADENAFLNLVTQQGNTLRASFPLPGNLEGYLFPDTYRIPVGLNDQQIAQIMVDRFDRLVGRKLTAEVRSSGHSLSDIVNIASMVEREAETDADRVLIAGVIYNRLAKHMHLEIDATVQYAQGFHKTRLLFRDLTIDSPYNTYKVFGLPIGPICNPGMPSIEAALHPAKSDYLYYVGKPNGSHIFAKTFAEHEHNIALVHQMARDPKKPAPATGTTP